MFGHMFQIVAAVINASILALLKQTAVEALPVHVMQKLNMIVLVSLSRTNCKGTHMVSLRSCPQWMLEKEIEPAAVHRTVFIPMLRGLVTEEVHLLYFLCYSYKTFIKTNVLLFYSWLPPRVVRSRPLWWGRDPAKFVVHECERADRNELQPPRVTHCEYGGRD